jgi:glycosyltransferase involved in cell wall biosynthesis
MRVGLLGHLLSFTPGYRRAGVSRYIEALVEHLPAAAPELELVVFTSRAGYRTAPERLRRSALWRVSLFPTERPLVRILWEQLAAPSVTRSQRLDLVHGPVNVVPLAGLRPLVVTVHDVAFLRHAGHYPPLKRRYLALMTRQAVRQADYVIAVSKQTRDDVIELCGADAEKVAVVPNGVDPTLRRINDASVLEAFRSRHHLPEAFVLFLGTLQPRKNVEGLLRAYARVRSDVSVPLVIAGARGWHESAIFHLVRELGLGESVQFAGYVSPEELPYWYSAATIFVYPSLYEGFGLPVLEAMACGTPVITSSVSSLPEVAGDAAVLVDPRDIDGLARAIRQLLGSSDTRASLSRAGLQRASLFTWMRTAEETLAVYRRAMELAESSRLAFERRR